ncbi:MAG: hypothetical protein D6736_11820 [Nitrospinota bacterium]|nr:MAG: hypothetical protein D6736_11820 [Nitrospinota bacterium]
MLREHRQPGHKTPPWFRWGWLLCLLLLSACSREKPPSITLPEDYKPLSNMVGQTFVFDQEMGFPAVMFVQDRNKDGYIDLVEYRVRTLQGWEPHTYKLIIDDDYNGYADRKVLSSKRNGVFDQEINIQHEKVIMQEIYSAAR